MPRRTLSRLLLLGTLVVVVFVPLASGSSQLKPGSLDRSFGKHGIVTAHVGASLTASNPSSPEAIVLQPDGKIVAAGYRGRTSTELSLALARYRRNGSRDRHFGTEGVVSSQIEQSSVAQSVVRAPDGKLVAVGLAQ